VRMRVQPIPGCAATGSAYECPQLSSGSAQSGWTFAAAGSLARLGVVAHLAPSASDLQPLQTIAESWTKGSMSSEMHHGARFVGLGLREGLALA
jgi:hypothetical protein